MQTTKKAPAPGTLALAAPMPPASGALGKAGQGLALTRRAGKGSPPPGSLVWPPGESLRKMVASRFFMAAGVTAPFFLEKFGPAKAFPACGEGLRGGLQKIKTGPFRFWAASGLRSEPLSNHPLLALIEPFPWREYCSAPGTITLQAEGAPRTLCCAKKSAFGRQNDFVNLRVDLKGNARWTVVSRVFRSSHLCWVVLKVRKRRQI